MIRKKRYLAAKMGLLALGIAMLLPGQKVDAEAKKTIYNSPYVTFSPDGKAWTTCAGDRDYTWYDAGYPGIHWDYVIPQSPEYWGALL